MRFMMLVKSAENSRLPPKELMEAIWKNGEDVKQVRPMFNREDFLTGTHHP